MKFVVREDFVRRCINAVLIGTIICSTLLALSWMLSRLMFPLTMVARGSETQCVCIDRNAR